MLFSLNTILNKQLNLITVFELKLQATRSHVKEKNILRCSMYRVSINDCLVKPALEKKFTVPLF
jgi:hypothetical protein